MSYEAKFVALADKFSDYINPILVKEARQALKSRQFVVTFMLLLLIAWLISALGVVMAGPGIEYGSPGRFFVMCYVFVLEFAVLFIVPFTAFRSMQVENELSTFELLSISNLSPKKIVLGKLGSAIVQVFLFYSAIAPFIAFTSLLQGFDLLNTVFLLVSILFWAIFACIFSIMLSAVSNTKQWATLNTLGILGLLFWQACGSFAFASMVMFEAMPFDDSDFWWGCFAFFVGFLGVFHLLQKIAESRLTFESDNRSTGIRIACLLLLGSQWGLLMIYGLYALTSVATMDNDLVVALMMLSTVFLAVMGLFAGTELDFMSRRVRRQIPKSKARGFIKAVLLPGGARGYAFFLSSLGLICLAGNLLVAVTARNDGVPMMLNGLALYAVIYVSFATAIGRWLHIVSPQVKPAHCRVITLLVAAIAMLVPYIPLLLGWTNWTYGYSLMDVTNPVATLSHIERNSRDGLSMVAFFLLCLAAGLGVLVNLPAVGKAIYEVVNYRPPQATGSAEIDTVTTQLTE